MAIFAPPGLLKAEFACGVAPLPCPASGVSPLPYSANGRYCIAPPYSADSRSVPQQGSANGYYNITKPIPRTATMSF